MQNTATIIDKILLELSRAETKYPNWPKDRVHAVGIMIEEAGEAMREAMNYTWVNGDTRLPNVNANPSQLETELVQTAAMCVRCLLHM